MSMHTKKEVWELSAEDFAIETASQEAWSHSCKAANEFEIRGCTSTFRHHEQKSKEFLDKVKFLKKTKTINYENTI